MERAARASLFVAAQQNRFLRRRFAVPALRSGSPDRHAGNRRREAVFDEEDVNRQEFLMTMFQPISHCSDRVMAALVTGLELEFGRGAAEALAARFVAAEECDFTWDARIEERWLGAYEALGEDDFELDRVAMIGRLDGRWVVAVCIVDGDGSAHGMVGRRSFAKARAARNAFATLH
ncbi:MAG: hypothetical protein V4472_12785 [Pseudomonadota bacterium]